MFDIRVIALGYIYNAGYGLALIAGKHRPVEHEQSKTYCILGVFIFLSESYAGTWRVWLECVPVFGTQ